MRPVRRIGDEPQDQAGVAQLGERLDGTLDGIILDVEHSIDVEQHGAHGTHHHAPRCHARGSDTDSAVDCAG